MRPVIVSRKHYVQQGLFVIGAAAAVSTTHIEAVAVLAKNLSSEVEEGSIVKAIYIDLWVTSLTSTQGNVIVIVEKVPALQVPASFTTMNALDTYANKKNILFTFEALTNQDNGNPLGVLHGWIKIPKGKQRFGLGDRLIVTVSAPVQGANACGFSTYKEYK